MYQFPCKRRSAVLYVEVHSPTRAIYTQGTNYLKMAVDYGRYIIRKLLSVNRHLGLELGVNWNVWALY